MRQLGALSGLEVPQGLRASADDDAERPWRRAYLWRGTYPRSLSIRLDALSTVMLTVGQAGNIDEVRAVVNNLKLCSHLANVGDAKTLIIHPWVTTHQQLPDEEKIKGGVTPDLIRVSLGLEDIKDIIFDFQQAFVAAGLQPAEKGVDPFQTASGLVKSGFMGKWATSAPKPGTDGSEGWAERNGGKGAEEKGDADGIEKKEEADGTDKKREAAPTDAVDATQAESKMTMATSA